VGISPERIQLFHCSAAEGQKFQNEAIRISEKIQTLGSNPLKNSNSSKKEASDSKINKQKKTE